MFKRILLVLAVIAAIFAVVVAMQKPEFSISRSVLVEAPAAKVFGIVNNIRRWNEWSPWAKLDPSMKIAYEGPASGVGASESWEGNSKVGSGKMTITESRPSQAVAMTLEFLKPMKAINRVDFSFTPEGKATRVTWTMSGKNGFVAKAFNLLMNMDKMIGPDFDKGLAGLKALAESK